MKTSDFYYELPPELIAQDPLYDRSASRLMVLDRENGSITETRFSEIGHFLKPGDLLVINDTKVIPARLIGCKADTGGKVEILLLKRLDERCWETLVKPGKKARPAGYAVGGKTGTAETFPRDKHDYVTSFMGYAPADDPKIIVYVVLDRPNLPDQQGGTALCCTMTKDILTEVLPYMNIFMTEELTDAEKDDLISKGLYNEAIYRPVHREDAGGDTDGISVVPDDRNIQIDKETGYAIDPETGEFLDPETGYPISPSSDLPDFSVKPAAAEGTEGDGTTTQDGNSQLVNPDGTQASTIQNYNQRH